MRHGPKVVLLGWCGGTWTKCIFVVVVRWDMDKGSIVVVGLWNTNNR